MVKFKPVLRILTRNESCCQRNKNFYHKQIHFVKLFDMLHMYTMRLYAYYVGLN